MLHSKRKVPTIGLFIAELLKRPVLFSENQYFQLKRAFRKFADVRIFLNSCTLQNKNEFVARNIRSILNCIKLDKYWGACCAE